MMIGEMEDVYTALHHNGDIEFEYKGVPYMIEAEMDIDKKRYLAIWTGYWDKKIYCVYKEEVFEEQLIEKEVVEKVLNAKCFDGKSFVEIQNDVELTSIHGRDQDMSICNEL